MATTNLFTDPSFKDGSFTANDPRVRAFALQKTMRAIDLGSIRERLGPDAQVLYALGCDNGSNDRSGFAEAVAGAQQADVILFVLGDRSGLVPGFTALYPG